MTSPAGSSQPPLESPQSAPTSTSLPLGQEDVKTEPGTSPVAPPAPPGPPVVAAPAPVKQEAGPAAAIPALTDSSTVAAILAFLKKNNLTGTEEQLKAELAKATGTGTGGVVATVPQDIVLFNNSILFNIR